MKLKNILFLTLAFSSTTIVHAETVTVFASVTVNNSVDISTSLSPSIFETKSSSNNTTNNPIDLTVNDTNMQPSLKLTTKPFVAYNVKIVSDNNIKEVRSASSERGTLSIPLMDRRQEVTKTSIIEVSIDY